MWGVKEPVKITISTEHYLVSSIICRNAVVQSIYNNAFLKKRFVHFSVLTFHIVGTFGILSC